MSLVKTFLGAAACALGLLGQPAVEIHSILIDGRAITYEVRNGYGVVQGDILIGLESDLASGAGAIAESRISRSAAGLIFSQARWPNATMFYVIDADVPNPSRILSAIDHWNTRTPLKIMPRTSEPNYVRFVRADPGDACTSYVGMQGGSQPIALEDGCTAGNTIHEIGHAWGLFHEQSRTDRNANLTVLFENIDKRFVSNFEQDPPDTIDQGYYDFASIMHYGFRDFTSNGADTLESVPVGIPFGQRTALSAGDIDGASRLYGLLPVATAITTIPEGLSIVVDGVPGVSPQSFSWAVGSTHNVSVAVELGTDPRYRLVRWTDGGDATHDITASTGRTVFAAVFQRLHLASVAVASGNGTVSIFPPSPDGYYPERMPVRIAAVPGSGSKLFTWSGAPDLRNSGYGLATETATIEVTSANTRYTAVFTTQVVTTIDSEPPGRRVLVDGSLTRTPARFAWTSGSSHVVSLEALQVEPSAASSQYRFTAWEDGSTDPSHTVMAGVSDTTYKATFTTRYLLSTSSVGPGGVTVSPSSPDGFYDAGSSVQLMAQPFGGSTLQYWMGDALGGDPVQTVTMNQARSVSGAFGPAIGFFVLHAGSYQFNPIFTSAVVSVAPGEIVAIFSKIAFGPAGVTQGQIQNGKFTTTLDGTQILFDGVPAPLLYGEPNFVKAVVPAGVSGKNTTQVQIRKNGVAVTGTISFRVQTSFPGIFTADSSGKGQIVAINEDFSINSPGNPAGPNSIVSFYVSGGGLHEIPLTDGQLMGFDLIHLIAPTLVRVGKLPAQITYSGSVPTLVNGVLLGQIRLPIELIGGPAVPIQLIFGNYSSPPGTTIAVK